MKKKDMYFFMYLRTLTMGNFQKEIKTSKLLVVELKLHHLKKIQQILFYGNLVLKINLVGNLLGVLEDLDGIQNVQQCQKKL